MRFRKKPVEVEAVRWTGENLDEIREFAGDAVRSHYMRDDSLSIGTLEGPHTASRGDWIIRGIQGEFYPCKPSIFEATYEAV